MPKRGKTIGPREMTPRDRQDIDRLLDAAGSLEEFKRWGEKVWATKSNFDEFVLQQLAAMEETWKYQSRPLPKVINPNTGKESSIKPIAPKEMIRAMVKTCLPTLADRELAEVDSVVDRIARKHRKRRDKAPS
jgi:hypothetical protein